MHNFEDSVDTQQNTIEIWLIKAAGLQTIMEELHFLGGSIAEILFTWSNTCYDIARNFMVSVVVLANFSANNSSS